MRWRLPLADAMVARGKDSAPERDFEHFPALARSHTATAFSRKEGSESNLARCAREKVADDANDL